VKDYNSGKLEAPRIVANDRPFEFFNRHFSEKLAAEKIRVEKGIITD
jgi:hypothetical protein